jgi:hypothetical protein
MPKVNNHPMGENWPNLVTLVANNRLLCWMEKLSLWFAAKQLAAN